MTPVRRALSIGSVTLAEPVGREPQALTNLQVQYSYPGLNTLEALVHPAVRFTTHENSADDVWRRVYRSQDLNHWLFQQQLQQQADQ